MKGLVFVSSLLVASGSATAAPFAALSYEAGGGLPGVGGDGFSVSSGGFFTSEGAGSNVFSGQAANFQLSDEQEFDSHFALDGFGPTARNRTVNPADNSVATLSFYSDYGPAGAAANNYDELEGTVQNGFGPFNSTDAQYVPSVGSHIGDPGFGGSLPENRARGGVGASPPFILSHFAPNATGGRSSFNGVFVGRFTIQRSASLTGGVRFNAVDPNSPTGFSGATLMLGGPGVAIRTINGIQVLGLRSYAVTTVDLANPSAATADGTNVGTPYGIATVYDAWVQVIPTPGTLALAGLAGIAAIRRRRA